MDTIQNTTTRFSSRISKLFKNQQIQFLIIMILILIITCYSLLTNTLKYTISMILSNPGIMIVCLILILITGYFNIAIASLMLILFFILLYGNINSPQGIESGIEGFKTTSSNNDNDEEDDESSMDKHIQKISKTLSTTQENIKKKEEKDKQFDERVNNIKNVVLSTINNIRNSNNDDYKRALLENKQALLYEEHENNSTRGNDKRKKESFKNTGKEKRNNKEKFQTIEVRALDPSNEEDTNLLITKEILQDMLNRIEYNYESNKYLRKYIKHRVEEIIDVNKLMDDE